MRKSTNFGLLLAALLITLVLVPSSGWATTTKNCPSEPTQGVAITSGETYFGSNCVLYTASDIDGFTFKASAGDTWTMVTAMTTGAYPNNICLNVKDPSGTTVASPCSNSAYQGYSAVATQKLTVTGTYTIFVTETVEAVINYGLSLERISLAPPDGIPLVLGKTSSGAVSAPTAQEAYTFYGATTGQYQVTATMTSGSYPENLCFVVYQPDGTGVTGACTNSAYQGYTASKEFTPAANGTYVVLVYESGNNATLDYNLSVVCVSGSCPVVQQPPPTKCTETPNYDATTGTLTMDFTIATNVAVTWNGWLVDGNTVQNMWTVSQPKTEPPVTVPQTHAVAAKSGVVGILSTFYTPPTTTATGGITCSSWQTISTGKP
jgi:hypothetical protein